MNSSFAPSFDLPRQITPLQRQHGFYNVSTSRAVSCPVRGLPQQFSRDNSRGDGVSNVSNSNGYPRDQPSGYMARSSSMAYNQPPHVIDPDSDELPPMPHVNTRAPTLANINHNQSNSNIRGPPISFPAFPNYSSLSVIPRTSSVSSVTSSDSQSSSVPQASSPLVDATSPSSQHTSDVAHLSSPSHSQAHGNEFPPFSPQLLLTSDASIYTSYSRTESDILTLSRASSLIRQSSFQGEGYDQLLPTSPLNNGHLSSSSSISLANHDRNHTILPAAASANRSESFSENASLSQIRPFSPPHDSLLDAEEKEDDTSDDETDEEHHASIGTEVVIAARPTA